TDYQALVDRAQFVTTQADQDGFDAEVSILHIRGLGSDMSALLIQAKDGRLWVALLDSGQVRYYSNAPDWTQHLPITVRTWIDSSSGVTQIKLMSARGKILSYP
ncbi:MAG: hypothetical protein LBV45_08360, partial [Xanthomonadaceae bacterium]|nr:hypothetical protein [Xanthomonadaceae bacterium]